MNGSGKKKLIISLFGLVILIFIGLGIFYYVNRLLTSPLTVDDIQVDSKAMLKLNIIEQISKKNGITEWKLKASSATLMKAENKAILNDVDIQFFTKDNTMVHLTSDQGILQTKTHDLTFLENVIVRYKSSTMRSDKLHYDKKPHMIHTDSRVRIEDGNSVIEADAMVTKLNENQTVLKGNVKGIFSDTIDLP